jgi:1-acyl-sn-glycerol-3-phosphate acyltransferase
MVPVAIDGLFSLWPRGRRFHWGALLPWRGSAVTIAVGPSIDVPRGAHTEATTALQSAVARLGVGARVPDQGAA